MSKETVEIYYWAHGRRIPDPHDFAVTYDHLYGDEKQLKIAAKSWHRRILCEKLKELNEEIEDSKRVAEEVQSRIDELDETD